MSRSSPKAKDFASEDDGPLVSLSSVLADCDVGVGLVITSDARPQKLVRLTARPAEERGCAGAEVVLFSASACMSPSRCPRSCLAAASSIRRFATEDQHLSS